jgi:hypothetical protein
MSDLRKRIDYGTYYCIISIKTPNTLATIASIAVTIATSVVLGVSQAKYSAVMFAGIIALYFLAMFIIGFLNYKKDINVPLLLTSNVPPLDKLKESMNQCKYTPWRINVFKREFGPSAFSEQNLTTVKIDLQYINVSNDLWATARTIRGKIQIIGKDLIGLNNLRFHLYVTEEIPTTFALIIGILLGYEHANFTIYTGGTQNRIVKILDSESITGMKIEEVQVSDASNLSFIANIYDREGQLEKENLSLEEVLELVKNGFTNFVLLVDLTASSLNRVPISNFIKKKEVYYNGFIITTTKEKIEGLVEFNNLQYLSMYFSNSIVEITKEGLNADGRIALIMKAPHPFNIVMGYKLFHQTNLEILHYNRRIGEYLEPILLKKVFET